MRRLTRSILFGTSLAWALAACGDGSPESDTPEPSSDEELGAFIETRMERAHVPGLATCIAKAGEVAWCAGFGDANRELGTAVTPDTPFLVASVSKTVTAAALMQQWERDAFDLDDDIGPALPFSLEHPDHATLPISYRALMTHTGSVRDNWDVMEQWYAADRDPPIALGVAMERYLSPTGADYHASSNFFSYAPGTQWNYSNVGISLAAYLLERHTGADFAAYCDEQIFGPLGMADTSWRLAEFTDRDALAMPYGWTGSSYAAIGHYTFADYPSGALRTSARDLAGFLLAIGGGGELGGVRILETATVNEMLRLQLPEVQSDQALIWFHTTIGDELWVTHSGGEQGVATLVLLRPGDGLGLVVLMNGGADPYAPVEQIVDRLLSHAQTL